MKIDYICKLRPSERFALDQWLCDYPSDKTYEEILETMRSVPDDWTHESIELWEVVENYPLGQVAEFIEDTRTSVVKLMQELKVWG